MSWPSQTIKPDWDAPDNVLALTTTRVGGVSRSPYQGFNLGDHVADSAEAVAQNRAQLAAGMAIPSSRLRWLKQVHGVRVINVDAIRNPVPADGGFTCSAGVACMILTADCLPILLCDSQGRQVSAVHGGWRGLAGGIINNAVKRFPPDAEILAWLGPAIGPQHFEVGDEVRSTFLACNEDMDVAFTPGKKTGKWYADLYAIARVQLQASGVHRIWGGQFCTYTQPERFYSYRRDGAFTGRMATAIWRR